MKAENSKVVIIALAANVGIVLAAIGLLLEGGSTLAAFREFDSIASILIGVLLGCVAIFLAREAKGLLIGESADPELIAGIRRAVTRDGVMGVGEIMTIHNAPEQIIDKIEQDLRAEFPSIYRVYVRPRENAGSKFGPGRGLETASAVVTS